MPACYLHEQVILQALRQRRELIAESRLLPMARMGAQGPDLLFSYRVLSSLRTGFTLAPQGRLMHTTKTGDFLCKLGFYAETPAARSFALGFLAHYATDGLIHPYVYGHAIPHLALEKRMDRALFRINGGKNVPKPFAFLPRTRSAWPEIARAWFLAAQEVYPDGGMHHDMLMEAFQDTLRVSRLTHSPTGVVYGLADLLEKKFIKRTGVLTGHFVPPGQEREDVLNLEKKTWVSPYEPDRLRDESVLELMQRAVEQCVLWMDEMNACWKGESTWETFGKILGQNSYLTGLPCEE